MDILNMPPGALTPHPKNARTHPEAQVEAIMESIRRFGFTSPVLTDADGLIIAGHARTIAAARLGVESIPVVRLDHLSPDEVRALMLADNKLSMLAEWDADMLASELSALSEIGIESSLLGFSAEELARISDDAVMNAFSSQALTQGDVGRTPTTRTNEAPTENDREPDNSGVVTFTCIVTVEDRKVILAAVDKAKRKHSLSNTSEALIAISREYLA